MARVPVPCILVLLVCRNCGGAAESAEQPLKATVSITSDVIFEVDADFKCWNIDPSPNRQWETRDLTNPKLQYLASQSYPGYLRFGGGGGDKFTYWCNQTAGTSLRAGLQHSPPHCLNQTWFDNFIGFVKASGAKLVFGLDIVPRTDGKIYPDGKWDSTAARRVISHAMSQGLTFFGFELGNERNPAPKPGPPGLGIDDPPRNITQEAREQAADFKVLADLVADLYPDKKTRPKLLGPDVHGLKQTPPNNRYNASMQYLKAFVEECQHLGVPLHAITHHEYIEIDEYSTRPPNASTLDVTGAIAQAVNASLAPYGIPIWAGEIGPHNGGSPGCDHSSMRWANFADSFWYLDAMAQKAAHGYSAFCRQDFVGIDYGMLDCATNDPLPDYYASILWSKLMGRSVLHVITGGANPDLRAYAHKAADGNGVTMLLMNLGEADCSVEIAWQQNEHLKHSVFHVYQLSGPHGTNSTRVALNGKLLQLDHNGQLPELNGVTVQGGSEISLPKESISFVQIVQMNDAAVEYIV